MILLFAHRYSSVLSNANNGQNKSDQLFTVDRLGGRYLFSVIKSIKSLPISLTLGATIPEEDIVQFKSAVFIRPSEYSSFTIQMRSKTSVVILPPLPSFAREAELMPVFSFKSRFFFFYRQASSGAYCS